MKKYVLAFICNGILLTGCQSLVERQVPTNTNLQEIWVDKDGYQADFQVISNCGEKSTISYQQAMATEADAKGLLDSLKDAMMEKAELNRLTANCMLSNGYFKTKATVINKHLHKP